MRVIGLDFETGGLQPSAHAIVSLGVAIMNGEKVERQQEWLFGDQSHATKNRRDYLVGSLSVSGAKWARIVKNGQPIREVYNELRSFIGEDRALPIVSHNALFDQAFYDDWLFRLGEFHRNVNAFVPAQSILLGPWYCTKRLATGMGWKPATLDGCLSRVGLARSTDSHGALEDAILAAKLLFKVSNAGEYEVANA